MRSPHGLLQAQHSGAGFCGAPGYGLRQHHRPHSSHVSQLLVCCADVWMQCVRLFDLHSSCSNCGVRTVDVGAPQLSMHSVREMSGTEDVLHSIRLFQHFFQEFAAVDASLKVD